MAKLLETPTDTLIHRLRLMAESGGNITRDRRATIIDAADRLESLDERIAIMSEYDYPDKTGGTFPPDPP